jgi:hypothetical protein
MQPENDRDSPLFRFLDYERVFTFYNTWFLEIINILVDNTFSIDTLQLCRTHVDIILVAKEERKKYFLNNMHNMEMHQNSIRRVIHIGTLIEKQILLCYLKPLLY